MRPFIENLRRQYGDSRFNPNEVGIDFYIDGARFLPENATFSRVIMRGVSIDQSNTRIFNTVKGGCDIDISTRGKPFYGFRYEIR